MKRPNLRIIVIEEGQEPQLQGPENILNKIIEENFPNLKKDMSRSIQKTYIPITLDQKKSPCTIIKQKNL